MFTNVISIRSLIIIAAFTAGAGAVSTVRDVVANGDEHCDRPTSNTAESSPVVELPLGHAGDLISDYCRRNSDQTWLKTIPENERTRMINELNEFTVSVEDRIHLVAGEKHPTWRFAEPQAPKIMVSSLAKSGGKLDAKISGPTIVDESGNKLVHIHFDYTFAPGHDLKSNETTASKVSFTVAVAIAPVPNEQAIAPATQPSTPEK